MLNVVRPGAGSEPFTIRSSSPAAELTTLHDPATYITKLPKADHDALEWQAAIEALMLAVDLGGPTMFARIGMTRCIVITNRPRSTAQEAREKISDRQMK